MGGPIPVGQSIAVLQATHLPDALHTRPPLSVHIVPSGASFALQMLPTQVAITHADPVAGQPAADVQETWLH